jgi:hypothetical protein
MKELYRARTTRNTGKPPNNNDGKGITRVLNPKALNPKKHVLKASNERRLNYAQREETHSRLRPKAWMKTKVVAREVIPVVYCSGLTMELQKGIDTRT